MLADRYLERAEKTGAALGFGSIVVRETPEGRAARPEARRDEEATALLGGLAADAFVAALDERGTATTSLRFAQLLADERNGGRSALAFVIGGADGLSEAVHARADVRLAFGSLTWPHQLVRVLLAEQIYRATTILSGHPYHRA